MIINQQNLEALRTGFKTNFQAGVGSVQPVYVPLVTPVSSTTKMETFGFLKEWPTFRKWLGDKRIKSLEEQSYTLINEDFEVTIGIHKNKIRDDSLGLYPSMIQGWGQEAGSLKDRLVFQALREGISRQCFDGQYFFDVDHPVKGGSASNTNNAAQGEAWYLLDCSKSLKPLILQTRQEPEFMMVTDPKDSHVFKTGEYLAGGEARGAVGYSFWQLAYRSTATLNPANYQAAKDAMRALTNDEGEPLGVKPTHGIFGVSNISAAKNLFTKTALAGGESNVLLNDVVIVEADRLP